MQHKVFMSLILGFGAATYFKPVFLFALLLVILCSAVMFIIKELRLKKEDKDLIRTDIELLKKRMNKLELGRFKR